ncbi:hypothetical protein V6N12_057861 [Hibiscus sabdariffa]|uniref:Uncharacterized protein n=1 Tax=Hibiscus sabdariffa TaxID=183260 RepID=A0ABR2B4J6_9ROSI
MDASIEDRYGARCSVRSWLMPECRTNMPAVAKAQEQLRDSGDDKEGPLPLHMPKPRSVKRGPEVLKGAVRAGIETAVATTTTIITPMNSDGF